MRRHGSSAIDAQRSRSRRATPPARRARRAARATASFRPAGMPCQTRSGGLRASPLRPLEPRRSLLDARHLRLDYVLRSPCPVEQFFVLGPWVLVGAVVVEP